MNKGRKVWWFPAPREGEIVPDYPPVELTGDVIRHEGFTFYEAAPATCANCERCTWNPGPDCGRAEHPHCPTCGHCEYRHE